ncbi:MAG: hypothetical protein GX222_08580 [Ruminococcaceae bacterium]|nr:hypothetical protein [Oscillospiraceae bacterium]
MICPRCKSNRVTIQAVEKVKIKRRGPLRWFLWILLAIVTAGLILIIPLLTNSKVKSKTHTLAVCQNCGKSWRIK